MRQSIVCSATATGRKREGKCVSRIASCFHGKFALDFGALFTLLPHNTTTSFLTPSFFLSSIQTGDKEIDPEKVIPDPPKYTTPGTSDAMRKRKKKTDAFWLTKEEATERFVDKYLPFRFMKTKQEENKSSSMILRKPHDFSTALDENKKK